MMREGSDGRSGWRPGLGLFAMVTMVILGFGMLTLVRAEGPPNGGGNLDTVDRVLRAQQKTRVHSTSTQERIDGLDNETRALLQEYRLLLEEHASLRLENEELARQLRAQEEERASNDRQLAMVGETRRALGPLMDRMVDALAELVRLDSPFLPVERRRRVEALRELHATGDAALTERVRRVFEAYQIEMDYGRNLEAYQDDVSTEGEQLTVDVLRFGRIGLYYLTLDGARAGMWDRVAHIWRPLPDDLVASVRRGLAIARGESPPELVTLPVLRDPRSL